MRRSKPEPQAAATSAAKPKVQEEPKKESNEMVVDFFTGDMVEVTDIDAMQNEKKTSPVRVSKGKSRPSRYAAESSEEEEQVEVVE